MIKLYEFRSKYIESEYLGAESYAFLGKVSKQAIISKIVYDHLHLINKPSSFCCDFRLVEKIINKLNSPSYLKELNLDSSVNNLIGAVLLDSKDDDAFFDNLFKIEDYLLTIYKKENNLYLKCREFLNKNQNSIYTEVNYFDTVHFQLSYENMTFNSYGKCLLEAKYECVEKFYNYLVNENLIPRFSKEDFSFTLNNAYETLMTLSKRGYFSEPIFTEVVHDDFETTKFESRCYIKEYDFYAVKIHNSIEEARNLSAFTMLNLIYERV